MGKRASGAQGEWQRRPVASYMLRLAVFGSPILASVAIAELLSRSLPRAGNGLIAGLWIAVVVCSSLLTLVVFERAARRLLPLAALLNVSLLFPDKAPARFAVARRTGSPRDLQQKLAEARAAGRQEDAAGMESVIDLVLALSVHDKATRGHSERVRVFTDMIADELKIDAQGQARLRWAALLHDVGKLEVAPEILNKPASPDQDEWAAIHRHPEEGARMVAPLLPWLGEWGAAVVEHHERFDGKGYPHGLRGDQISLGARIVAVADTYEVMTAPRPYKHVMSIAAAREELTRVAGTQLDPGIVRAFLNVSVGRLWRTIGFGAWLAQIPAITRVLSSLGQFGSWAVSGAATATTATVLTLGSIGGTGFPTPSPGAAPATLAPAATAPVNGPGTSGQADPTSGAAPGAPLPTVSGPTAPSTTAPSTAAASSAPPPTGTPLPTSQPRPTATPTPTPTPTPSPSGCPSCTNSSPTCTSYCTGNNLSHCTTYCEGQNNSHCQSYCWGNNNPKCTQYCYGANNPKCTSDCGATVAAWYERAPLLAGSEGFDYGADVCATRLLGIVISWLAPCCAPSLLRFL